MEEQFILQGMPGGFLEDLNAAVNELVEATADVAKALKGVRVGLESI